MATLTFTKTEQTNSDSSSIATKSNTSESNTPKQNTRIKNKNAVLRKSKSAQNGENSNNQTKSQLKEEPHEIKSQLSRPELDGGDADSAIGSEVNSVIGIPFEDEQLLNENDKLLDDLDNLILQPACATLIQSRIQKNSNLPSPSSRIFSGQPAFVVPKLPIAPTRAVHTAHSTLQKRKIQHNRIQPVDKVPESNAFQTKCLAVSNNLETSDVRIDGEQSLSTKLPFSYGTAASSLPPCSREDMSDFVILHTDADMEEACAFMTHLVNDTGIENLTVDMFSNIDAGKPGMQSLGKLHEKYRYILTYVTDNLASDKYCRFLQEILLTFGLQEANGKEDRVVPVFTKNERCKILEISVIRGLQYFKFHSLNRFISDLYLKSVRNLVQDGRAKFP
ncbi:uncharacterized protein LOC128545978 isoform X2 [Mercenaria mercenaria]|nr:uncharacterized protein LOC128545978 isoform X2 [Mercenaria mercenaria]XP_053408410.1 uncharacterized protein LOC128545978 isoform X2 [Mercenaria mercenaria]